MFVLRHGRGPLPAQDPRRDPRARARRRPIRRRGGRHAQRADGAAPLLGPGAGAHAVPHAVRAGGADRARRALEEPAARGRRDDVGRGRAPPRRAHARWRLGWGAAVYWLAPSYIWWLLPVVGALALSIPISVYSSRVSLGRALRRARAVRDSRGSRSAAGAADRACSTPSGAGTADTGSSTRWWIRSSTRSPAPRCRGRRGPPTSGAARRFRTIATAIGAGPGRADRWAEAPRADGPARAGSSCTGRCRPRRPRTPPGARLARPRHPFLGGLTPPAGGRDLRRHLTGGNSWPKSTAQP